ncbi:hypothetical protein Pth03_37830 [Planotetraspora thailandica]|uniref:Uncharacterized protein n=1 Tax=Planotetraspora thailandica TaxID=487172 RepID=A0A8J3V7F9_9ACTN|nr:hypothetical protein [Planotetraspora thailandica]GII55394.1 hypothetical protein Pth03_37830 [Planotetraspora thailandica]
MSYSSGLPGYPNEGLRSFGCVGVIVFAVLTGAVAAGLYFGRDTDMDHSHVVVPQTLAGRARITDPDFQATADEQVARLKKQAPNATGAISAFYGIPDKQDVIMITGLSASMATSAVVVRQSFAGLADSGAKVTNMRPTETGPFGGAAACADADIDDVPAGVCVWADDDTFGQIVVYFRSRDEAEAEFEEFRSEIEQPA